MADPQLARAADAAVGQVLEQLCRLAPATVVAAPPGAGKTGLVERIAALEVLLNGARVGVATFTNAQAVELVRRVATAYPDMAVWVYGRSGMRLPAELAGYTNVQLATSGTALPAGSALIVGTAAKWGWIDPDSGPVVDVLVVDEAYQLTDTAFAMIARVGSRLVLVGDPGQIEPVVTADVTAWAADPAGPHRRAPDALLARRRGEVTLVQLPATRRLPADTATLIQPVLYPNLPFGSLRDPVTLIPDGATPAVSAARDGLARTSIVAVEIPGDADGVADGAIADAIAELVRACATGTVRSAHGERPLHPGDVAVVCAHVAQTAAVRARLGAGYEQVAVETADRFQGQEREAVIVWHPLSGRGVLNEFAVESGRWCVMLSRHRAGCIVVTRPGIEQVLARLGGAAQRLLAVGEDPTYTGWRAHAELWDALGGRGSILQP